MVIPTVQHLARLTGLALMSALILTGLTGCKIVGVMADTYERTKVIDIQPEYYGLENMKSAVMVDASMDIQFEYPQAVPVLTDFISLRLSSRVPGAQVLMTRDVLAYQNQNVSWPMMDYAVIAAQLGVDRLILVDVVEYRLFEPGNQYYWDGRVIADINIFEAESPDSTEMAFTQRVEGLFPEVDAVGRHQATEQQVQMGLQLVFSERVGWLFHQHQRQNQDIIDEARREKRVLQ